MGAECERECGGGRFPQPGLALRNKEGAAVVAEHPARHYVVI